MRCSVLIVGVAIALGTMLSQSWSQEATKQKEAPPPQSSSSIQPEEVTVTNAATGQKFAVRVFRPTEFKPAQAKKYPALLVQGALGPFGVRDVAEAVEKGIVVMYCDPPLPPEDGSTAELPEGARRFGYKHQDNFNSAAKHLASLPEVDTTNIGVVSFSGGCMLVAGALARHPNDPKIKYWIDGEGPSNRHVVLLDIPGIEYRTPQKFPELVGYGKGDERSQKNYGHSINDDVFWGERDATKNISKITCRYLRLQAEVDHVQKQYFGHATEMLNAAHEGSCPWTRCNDGPVNAVHKPDDPSTLKLLPGHIADHKEEFVKFLMEMVQMQ